MEFVTVTFDRVFELSRGLTSPPHSEFSFQAAGLRQFAVRVPGMPKIEPGMTVTALLAKPGDWQTLRGWKNWTNGELALPSLSVTALAALGSAGLGFCFAQFALAPYAHSRAILGFFAVAFSLSAVLGCVQFVRRFRVVRQLRGLKAPPERGA